MILLIDNFDSFAHNLARYLRQLGQGVNVVRNNQIELADIERMQPSCLIMSPGPCTPDDAGICLRSVRRYWREIPILGVCLGHQAICQSFGGQIVPATPLHGQVSEIHHGGHPVFDNIPSPFWAGRYHSLVARRDSVPRELEIIAESNQTVMGVAHREHPVMGVQFHPESILTQYGYRLLANFLQVAGFAVDVARVEALQQRLSEQQGPLHHSADSGCATDDQTPVQSSL